VTTNIKICTWRFRISYWIIWFL